MRERMKPPNNHRFKASLKKMTVEKIVELFCTVALDQDDALLGEELRKVNACVWKLRDIEEELKLHPGDQRSALMRLYDHPNAQVRLNAIRATLAVAPARARAALEALAKSKQYPAAGDAGMSLWALDRGIYKPR
jgi:hypothetical protein